MSNRVDTRYVPVNSRRTFIQLTWRVSHVVSEAPVLFYTSHWPRFLCALYEHALKPYSVGLKSPNRVTCIFILKIILISLHICRIKKRKKKRNINRVMRFPSKQPVPFSVISSHGSCSSVSTFRHGSLESEWGTRGFIPAGNMEKNICSYSVTDVECRDLAGSRSNGWENLQPGAATRRNVCKDVMHQAISSWLLARSEVNKLSLLFFLFFPYTCLF